MCRLGSDTGRPGRRRLGHPIAAILLRADVGQDAVSDVGGAAFDVVVAEGYGTDAVEEINTRAIICNGRMGRRGVALLKHKAGPIIFGDGAACAGAAIPLRRSGSQLAHLWLQLLGPLRRQKR